MRISDWSSDVCSSDLFELTGRGEVIGVGTPQTGFEFSACECGIQGLLELLQVVGGGQFALAPQALEQVRATLHIGAATGLPLRPGRLRGRVGVDGATEAADQFEANAVDPRRRGVGLRPRGDNFGAIRIEYEQRNARSEEHTSELKSLM